MHALRESTNQTILMPCIHFIMKKSLRWLFAHKLQSGKGLQVLILMVKHCQMMMMMEFQLLLCRYAWSWKIVWFIVSDTISHYMKDVITKEAAAWSVVLHVCRFIDRAINCSTKSFALSGKQFASERVMVIFSFLERLWPIISWINWFALTNVDCILDALPES